MHTLRSLTPRLLAGIGTAALLAGIGLVASRPAHTAGGPVPVTVANSPLATADLDDPDQQPFQITLSPSNSTFNSAIDLYTVPAGKRVVIDYYSTQLTQYPAGGYGYMYLITTAGGNEAFYRAISPIASTATFNQVTHIYADPGTTIQASVGQSSGTSCGGNIILSGHMVNVR